MLIHKIDKKGSHVMSTFVGEGETEITQEEYLEKIQENVQYAAFERGEHEELLAKKQKIDGFEFEGVMCSATGEDQNGLMAIAYKFNLLGDNFTPTKMNFENGNTLIITKDNFTQFQTEWMQFRGSFFEVEESE